jgi:chromosome segregation ATPase
MAKKAAHQRQISEWQDQTRRFTEEENRLRQNVNTTQFNNPAERELRAKWMTALSTAEENLASLRGKIDDLSAQVRQLDEDMAKKIREFKGE